MRITRFIVVVGLGILVANAPLFGHHAFGAEFDANKPVKLRGIVTKVEWINPHVWIVVDVKNPDGTAASWAIEFGAPNALIKRGWLKTSLPVGAAVVVQGFRAKDGTTAARGRDVAFADGRSLFTVPGSGAP